VRLVALLLSACVVSGSPLLFETGRSQQAVLLGVRHEAGVESKALVSVHGSRPVLSFLNIHAGIGLSLFQHNGLSDYGLGVRIRALRFGRIELDASCCHSQWNDWRIGENRVMATAHTTPLRTLHLGAGIAYRAPVFDDGFASPLAWDSDMPEFNLVYELDWTFLEIAPVDAVLTVSNADLLRMSAPSRIPLRVSAIADLLPGWSLLFRCGTGIKGLSSLLLSVSEVTAELGVRLEF
jgi:hypothetical protein